MSVLLFFFFKQKTAYEMRISDWSSDVCSSDLDDGDLGNALGGEVGLIEEDTAEVVAVGKHLVLARQVGAAGIDQVDARQMVLLGNLLGSQMLLHGDREVGAAFHRGVVSDDHALAAGHPRSEEHTSELQSLMRISYAVFCLK